MIRFAESDDFEQVAGLLEELGRPPVLRSALVAAHVQLFQNYLARDDTAALVADVDGDVVGFLAMEYRQRLHFSTPQAWIPDLVVSADRRSGGLGAELLERAEELASERGCWGMTLESATWRDRAHSFYVSRGWKDTGKSFNKNLTGVEWPPAPKD